MSINGAVLQILLSIQNFVRGALNFVGYVITSAGGYNLSSTSDSSSVYITNTIDNNIYQYSRDLSTGLLTQLSPLTITNGISMGGIAVSPDKKSVYCSGSGFISQFSRDLGTGVLTALSPAIIALSGNNGRSVLVSPDDLFVYAGAGIGGAGLIDMYSRNPVTGLLTFSSSYTCMDGAFKMVMSVDGKSLYTIGNNNLLRMFSRDLVTGALTSIGTVANFWSEGLAISPDDKHVYSTCTYTAPANFLSIFSRDLITGLLTTLSTISTGVNPWGVQVSSDGMSVYVANSTDNTISLFTRNAVTGILTPMLIPTIATDSFPTNLIVTNDNNSVYTCNNNRIDQLSR